MQIPSPKLDLTRPQLDIYNNLTGADIIEGGPQVGKKTIAIKYIIDTLMKSNKTIRVSICMDNPAKFLESLMVSVKSADKGVRVSVKYLGPNIRALWLETRSCKMQVNLIRSDEFRGISAIDHDVYFLFNAHSVSLIERLLRCIDRNNAAFFVTIDGIKLRTNPKFREYILLSLAGEQFTLHSLI